MDFSRKTAGEWTQRDGRNTFHHNVSYAVRCFLGISLILVLMERSASLNASSGGSSSSRSSSSNKDQASADTPTYARHSKLGQYNESAVIIL